jgi:uridine kinase
MQPLNMLATKMMSMHACSRSNMMAIEMVTEHLKVKLQQHPLERQYPNLECMKSSPIVKEMHTLIRDRSTGRADFVFYADRLIRLVVETGLGYLPFKEKCVATPDGYHYVGVDFARSLCGVSIIRSGEAMESALRDCCQGIKIGKV